MKLQEDKTRFINNLPWETSDEKQKVLDFFKTHANLESKIQNWQSKDKENLVNEIRNLISEVEKASLEKEKVKQGYKGNIDWESHDCRYLGEDENWIYITPLSWKGAVFCDSAACGGAGAKWCIGYEESDESWNYYRKDGALFLMKFNKHPENKRKDLKFMIQGYPSAVEVNIWDQTDSNDEEYILSEKEKEYLEVIQKIWDDIRRETINKCFDNPEPGVYIAKDEEAPEYIRDLKKDLRVFKVKEGVIFKNKNASWVFQGCTSLTSVDTSGFVNVTDAHGMFLGCKSLTSVDTSGFVNVWNAEEMFKDCDALTSIDTSGFVNVNHALSMFDCCTSLTSIDTSGFVNVVNAYNMFRWCTSLASIDTSVFKKVESAWGMFSGCESLTSIDTSVFGNAKTAVAMFERCKSLTSIDTSAFRNVRDAREMFYDCTYLTSIDTSSFVNVVNARGMFDKCPSLKIYIPGPNNLVNGELEKIGAKPVKRLGESYRRRVIEEILEE